MSKKKRKQKAKVQRIRRTVNKNTYGKSEEFKRVSRIRAFLREDPDNLFKLDTDDFRALVRAMFGETNNGLENLKKELTKQGLAMMTGEFVDPEIPEDELKRRYAKAYGLHTN